jgi:hypothetical protein
MREHKKHSPKPALPVALLGALLVLSACGGGSGGSPAAPSAPALSETQYTYESFALASNGGLFDLEGDLEPEMNSAGATVISPVSTFYTEQISIPKSPAGGPQPLTDTIATAASTLPAPTSFKNSRLVVGGAVYVATVPSTGQVKYSGNNVETDYYATGTNTVVLSTLSTSYTVTNLNGLIAASPWELFGGSSVGLIQSFNGQPVYNQNAMWQPQSAYIKVVRQMLGDSLAALDCAAPATDGVNVTPCSTTVSTLENFFPAVSPVDGKTYQIGDGQIVNSQNGVRAWVSNTPVASVPTTSYAVFYQLSGAIYSGLLVKDGTTTQSYATAQDNSIITQNFKILLNAAAVNSIKSAVTF